MAFLKFWNKKGKSKDDAEFKKDEAVDPEVEKRRLRHSLSISRSGRFKQKRERGGILNKPELYDGQQPMYSEQSSCSETSSSASNSSATSNTSSNSTNTTSRSPKNVFRSNTNTQYKGRTVAL